MTLPEMDSVFTFLLFPPQERLSYIGPEEFVQAFVQKDPLDNDKVTSAFQYERESPDKTDVYSRYATSAWPETRPGSPPSGASYK